ncbi:MAG TPA: hypothetical protein VN841_02295 [Bryobacteraceae bacterium]|nr:hypothetical protein [Bryobacteraceae bacterium]
MSHRPALIAISILLALPLAAQQPSGGAKPVGTKPAATTYVTPRTAWGDPDLQGVYTFATETPLQRPAALGDKATYTEAELKKLEQQTQEKHEENIATNEHFSYNALWFVGDQGRPTGRTSLIVDPPNGRMPPLTERGEQLRTQNTARLAARRAAINTWADHSNYDQCLSRPMPRVSQEYNQGVEILQTPKDVTIFYESMHDVRIIPLDGTPHMDASLRQWNGDSRGHWEGNTLVVDSTNFTDKQRSDDSAPFGGFPQGNLHLTERFTRTDANTIMYQVTVQDLSVWISPFTFVLPWRSDDPAYKGPEDLFEYACHEGNYRMIEDTITGSRAAKTNPTGTKQ